MYPNILTGPEDWDVDTLGLGNIILPITSTILGIFIENILLSPIELTWHLCKKSVDHVCMDSVLDAILFL